MEFEIIYSTKDGKEGQERNHTLAWRDKNEHQQIECFRLSAQQMVSVAVDLESGHLPP